MPSSRSDTGPNGHARFAVDLVASRFSPAAIHLYGDTARGRYPDDARIEMLVVADSDDIETLWEDILIALGGNGIDAKLYVLTPEAYEDDMDRPYTVAYRAVHTGFVAYAREGPDSPHGYESVPDHVAGDDLRRIAEWCDVLESYMDHFGRTPEDFEGSEMYRDCCYAKLVQISACADRVAIVGPDETSPLGLRASELRGLREAILHESEIVDPMAVWDFMVERLPELRSAARGMLRSVPVRSRRLPLARHVVFQPPRECGRLAVLPAVQVDGPQDASGEVPVRLADVPPVAMHRQIHGSDEDAPPCPFRRDGYGDGKFQGLEPILQTGNAEDLARVDVRLYVGEDRAITASAEPQSAGA